MSCNCNKGRNWLINMGCSVGIIANADNYYTKCEIDEMIDEISGMTPSEVQSMIDDTLSEGEYVDEAALSAYTYGKAELDDMFSSDGRKITQLDDDLREFSAATNAALATKTTEQWVSGFTYDKNTIDEKIAEGGTFDPTQYYTKTDVDNIVESAITEVEGDIPTDVSELNNDVGYITVSALNGYATEQWVENKNYALRSEIPTVPTNVSAFNNDAGYLTQHQSLSAYSTTSQVEVLINQATVNKQDISGMTAYTTTATTDALNNVVTAHTENTQIHTTSQEKSNWNDAATNASTALTNLGGLKLQQVTQAQYDALVAQGTVDNSTIYYIVD